jgi:thiosulfate dehydrogenase [quinone] large subunit
MDTHAVTATVDDHAGRWAPTVLRWTAALLWLANVNWKVPPDFGRVDGSCRALCRFVEAGAEYPVAPGSAWFFENVASPNLALFGWVTLVAESVLVVLLASGRFVRTGAVLGAAMSVGIGLAVANAEHEWYWSYVLMVVLHLGILGTAGRARPQSARAMAAVTVGYGVVVAITHAGDGLTGGGDGGLFSQGNDIPGEWGRGTFPGSLALGLGFVAVGAAAWFLVNRLDPGGRRILGWAMVGVGAVLLATYRPDGLVLGLGSRPGNACMLAALGLALAVAEPRPSGAHVAPGTDADAPAGVGT